MGWPARARLTMRVAIKATAEFILARGGAAYVGRALRRHQALVLSYHNVVPDGSPRAGDASLHLPARAFAAQMDALSGTHEIVPLGTLIDDTPGPGLRPRAAITFDDAYQGAVTIAIEELRSRGLPATMFVAPGYLGAQEFWWDRLADPATGEVAPEVRDPALRDFAGQGSEIIAALMPPRAGPASQLPAMLSATEEELLSAASRHPDLSLGSHSWSHPNLAALDPARLQAELEQPLVWLRDRFSQVSPCVSYPYGLHSDRTRDAARRAGYTGGVTQVAGWYSRDAGDRLAIPRLNVPAGLSLDGFVAAVAGVR